LTPLVCILEFSSNVSHPHSFPTRRSSDLIVNGERKAELLQQIAEEEDISLEKVIAVGDGANDLPMLGVAGLGIAFRAKPLVKERDRKSTRLNSSHVSISYAVFCLKKKIKR